MIKKRTPTVTSPSATLILAVLTSHRAPFPRCFEGMILIIDAFRTSETYRINVVVSRMFLLYKIQQHIYIKLTVRQVSAAFADTLH